MSSNKYVYRYDAEGHKYPISEIPDDLQAEIKAKGASKNNRKRLWKEWQKKGLPLPDPQTGRTGIMRQAVQNYHSMTPQEQRELRAW